MTIRYDLDQQKALLKGHDRLMRYGLKLMQSRYGDTLAQTFMAESRTEFESLIPHIPYIGGRDNPLTDTLVQMTSLLALYRVMKHYDYPVDEIGDLAQAMATNQIEQFPRAIRHLIGRIYMTRLWRRRTAKKAQQSQTAPYPGNFVYEVVEGDGKDFEWGVNYLECGVVKFFHSQDADEFSPYMCLIDFLIFPGMGIELERHGTIANGCSHCEFRFRK
ncbi:MAG: L-2-amino-thiazoline-4-carboxylic acid hydrolase [Anaerolineae bacterium]|nr:L-2-amino-thiazoline-4-carboxylic acid hydrolase [Anaerolineae bacterium]